MAELNSLKLKLDTSDIDQIVRLFCAQLKCANNMVNISANADCVCNLKYVALDDNGKCLFFKEKEY